MNHFPIDETLLTKPNGSIRSIDMAGYKLMQLFNYEVRQDWEEFDRKKNIQFTWLWRLIQIGVILSTLAVIMISMTAMSTTWQMIAALLLSFVFFLAISLWTVYRSEKYSLRTTLAVFFLLSGMAIIAGYTRPLPSPFVPGATVSIWPYQLALFIPAAGFGILIWSFRNYPVQMRRLSLSNEQLPAHLLVGTSAGGILAFHYLLTTYLITGVSNPLLEKLPVITWTFFVYSGLAALGEELFLRGVCYFLLYEESHSAIWKATWQIMFLNILIYLAPFPDTAGTFWWVLMLAYRAAFSLIATWLRYRRESLIPCIACNVIFQALIAMV